MSEHTNGTECSAVQALDRDMLVRELRGAVEEVFATMLGVPVHAVPPYVASTDLGSADGVMSLIGMAGPWTGAGSVICSAGCACWLASCLLMTEYEVVNHEVLDAVAELTNMMIGSFKTLLEPHTGPLGLSIPSVVYGRNFTVRNGGAEEWTVVPFAGAGHKFDIRICLTRAREVVRPPVSLCA